MSVAVPTNVRAINGNPGKRALRAPGEPDPDYLVDLTPPPFLTSAKALEVWDYMAPKLVKARLLCEVDIVTFAHYCEAVAEFWQTQQQVSNLLVGGDAEALMVAVGGNGGRNYHPAITLRNRAADRVDKGAMHFGLSPMARTKIRTNAQEDLFGGFDEFLQSLPMPAAA